MFEKRKPFNWKVPVLVVSGIVALTGGVYVGVKSNEEKPKVTAQEQKSDKKEEKEQKENDTKETFKISKDCEIWVQAINEDGSETGKAPTMIGTVDKSLTEMNEEEISTYLKEKYPERTVKSISKYEIVLNEIKQNIDASRINKFSLEADNELIGLYKYDGEGKRELVEDTQIHINSLPKSIQDEIKKGVVVDTQEEAYLKLENFGS